MLGWSRDGSKVLFSSPRDLTYQRGGALFLVSMEGGLPERLPMPYGWDGDFPEDGGRIADHPFFWSVENEGIAPDIEVEQIPREVIDGHDPQLERAIVVILEQLRAFDSPVTEEAPPAPRPAAGN